MILSKSIHRVLPIIFVISSLKMTWDVFWKFVVVFHAPVSGDAFTYLSMGRLILNGLTPYKDLLEIKPPGMFLISALAHGTQGAWLLNFIILLAIPFLITLLAYKHDIPVTIGWILGGAFTIYVMKSSATYQTEAFGVFCCVLFLLSFTIKNNWKYVLCTLSILGAVGLKEPFILALFASVIILGEWKTFLPSLLAATLLGVILLAILGYLSYFTLYLPAIQERAYSPGTDYGLFFRGLFVIRLFKDIAWFSEVPVLGYILCSSWLLFPSKKPFSIAGMAALAYGWHLSALYWQLIHKLGGVFPFQDRFFLFLTLQYVIVSFVCIFLFVWSFKERKIFWRMITAAFALYITVFAVGIGNFFLQHYLFAVPFYLTLFLSVKNKWIFLGIAMIPFLHTSFPYSEKLVVAMQQQQNMLQEQAHADRIDETMNRCGFDRYFDLTNGAIVGLTKHSPLNLQWEMITAFQWNHNEEAKRKFFEKIHSAKIVIINPKYVEMLNSRELEMYLSKLSPVLPCSPLKQEGIFFTK